MPFKGGNACYRYGWLFLLTRMNEILYVGETMRFRERAGGCGFTVATTLLSCMLLVMNGGVVAAIYFSLAPVGPKMMQDPRLTQLALFVVPIAMLLSQWWLIDFAGSRSARRTLPQDPFRDEQ